MEENSGKANVLNETEKPVRRRREGNFKINFKYFFASLFIVLSELKLANQV